MVNLRARILAEEDGIPRTVLMKLLEERYDSPISKLIAPQIGVSGNDMARFLGINPGTLSTWRKMFGMNGVKTVRPGPRTDD